MEIKAGPVVLEISLAIKTGPVVLEISLAIEPVQADSAHTAKINLYLIN